MLTSAFFLKKERKDNISSQITYRKADTFIKILKLHGIWQHESHFWYGFRMESLPTAFSASLNDFL